MKRLTTLFALLVAFSANATVFSVDNSNPTSQSLADAISSASSGDSIYIHGSATVYDSIVVDRQVAIFGQSHSEDPTSNGEGFTPITSISKIIFSGANASKSYISGLRADKISCTGKEAIDNITIERCMISTGIYPMGNNWLIVNSIIKSIDGTGFITLFKEDPNYAYEIRILNNFIYNASNLGLEDEINSRAYFHNNIFFGAGEKASNLQMCEFYYNIFHSSGSFDPNSFNCFFDINLTTNSSVISLPAGENPREGETNYEYSTPFIGSPSPDMTFDQFIENYSLFALNHSDSKNVASTTYSSYGSYIGVQGDHSKYFMGKSYVFPTDFVYPKLPRINNFYIENDVITPGESLKIQFEGVYYMGENSVDKSQMGR